MQMTVTDLQFQVTQATKLQVSPHLLEQQQQLCAPAVNEASNVLQQHAAKLNVTAAAQCSNYLRTALFLVQLKSQVRYQHCSSWKCAAACVTLHQQSAAAYTVEMQRCCN